MTFRFAERFALKGWWLAVATFLACAAAEAQPVDPYQGRSEWEPIDAEVLQLPEYCQADLRPTWGKSPGTSAYGCTFFNHFCPGLVAINRAMNQALSMRRRAYNLQLAADHIGYTRGHMAAGCKLEPHVRATEMRIQMLKGFIK